MNKKIVIVIFLVISGIAVLLWNKALRSEDSQDELVSRGPFHWHPELAIYVKGEKLEIPPNIGLGVVHQPIHTHGDSIQGILHMEFQGSARKNDTALGQFFKNWGKDMRSFGMNMQMTVNGEVNTEYENYMMRDKDKIELRFD